jgi:prepilin-type N-terminal cleavage/methylation domain-containing protein
MKKNNKKGFTIVELVIVIAVIAILAAVLIPTFSSVIAKANLAADKQTVRQLNVALATGDNVDTYNEMADILVEQGYNGKQTIIPASSGHSYYWVKQYNTIVLVKDGAVVFPEDNKFASLDLTAEGVYAFSAGNYIETVAGSEAFAEAITKGNSVKFSEDIAVSATQTIKKDLTIVKKRG